MTSNYKMILGDERSTSLPENTFEKILITNSFHEFTFITEMLTDIKKKLKAGGILYIDEALPKRQGNYMAFVICLCLTMKKQLLCLQKMVLNM